MKVKYTHKFNFEEADELIEKYYDGLTTVVEEKELRNFLSQANLPEQYKAERDILGFFETKKQKTKVQIISFRRWSSVAAVLIVGVFCIKFYMTGNSTNFAYVDGEKITDVREVKQNALASLNELPSATDEMADGLNSLNDGELIDQQLDVFSNN